MTQSIIPAVLLLVMAISFGTIVYLVVREATWQPAAAAEGAAYDERRETLPAGSGGAQVGQRRPNRLFFMPAQRIARIEMRPALAWRAVSRRLESPAVAKRVPKLRTGWEE